MVPRHPALPEWLYVASRQPNDGVGKTTLIIRINKVSITLSSVNDIHVTARDQKDFFSDHSSKNTVFIHHLFQLCTKWNDSVFKRSVGSIIQSGKRDLIFI